MYFPGYYCSLEENSLALCWLGSRAGTENWGSKYVLEYVNRLVMYEPAGRILHNCDAALSPSAYAQTFCV